MRIFTLVASCAFALASAAPTGAVGPSAPDPAHGWQWPTGGPVPIARAFDPPAQPWLAGHRGVDLQVEVGSLVRAPAAGTVVQAGTVVDRGVVSIQHEGGVRSTFEPVDALVHPGQRVAAGEAVGRVQPDGAHGPLHWGARIGADRYIDPLALLAGRVVLKLWQ